MKIKATKILLDATRGPFVLLKVWGINSQTTIAIAFSDLNTERFYRLMGKHGILLVDTVAKTACCTNLQKEIVALGKANKIYPMTKAGNAVIEMPLM